MQKHPPHHNIEWRGLGHAARFASYASRRRMSGGEGRKNKRRVRKTPGAMRLSNPRAGGAAQPVVRLLFHLHIYKTQGKRKRREKDGVCLLISSYPKTTISAIRYCAATQHLPYYDQRKKDEGGGEEKEGRSLCLTYARGALRAALYARILPYSTLKQKKEGREREVFADRAASGPVLQPFQL